MKLLLKIKSAIIKEDINQVNNQYHEELLKNQEAESIVENTSNEEEVSFTQEATQEQETSLKKKM
jgi:cell division protein FtsZ